MFYVKWNIERQLRRSNNMDSCSERVDIQRKNRWNSVLWTMSIDSDGKIEPTIEFIRPVKLSIFYFIIELTQRLSSDSFALIRIECQRLGGRVSFVVYWENVWNRLETRNRLSKVKDPWTNSWFLLLVVELFKRLARVEYLSTVEEFHLEMLLVHRIWREKNVDEIRQKSKREKKKQLELRLKTNSSKR